MVGGRREVDIQGRIDRRPYVFRDQRGLRMLGIHLRFHISHGDLTP